MRQAVDGLHRTRRKYATCSEVRSSVKSSWSPFFWEPWTRKQAWAPPRRRRRVRAGLLADRICANSHDDAQPGQPVPQQGPLAFPGGGACFAAEAAKLVEDGEFLTAVVKLREAIAAEMDLMQSLQSRINLGCTLHRLEKFFDAKNVLEDAQQRHRTLKAKVASDPRPGLHAHLTNLECVILVNLSCCAEPQHDPIQQSRRRSLLSEALALNPKNREALMHLAIYESCLHNWEESLKWVENILRAHGNDLEGLSLQCRCLYRLGRRQEALTACERLCRADPASIYASLNEVFDCKPDDVFVVTYPRCGTTWMVQVATNILYGSTAAYNDHAVFVEGNLAVNPGFLHELEALPSPRIMKMHVPADVFPGLARQSTDHLQQHGKVVYVVRNPKDALVSLRHHHDNNRSIAWNGTWDDWVDQWLCGKRSAEYGGTYFEHVRLWWRLSRLHPTRVRICYFEDMKTDLESSIGSVAIFLGKFRSAGEIRRIAHTASFDQMQAKHVVPDAVKDRVNAIHFRKGDIGSWREVLNSEQAKRVDDVTRKELREELAQGLRIHGLPEC